MEIQSEAVLPLDPLETLDEDYEQAVLHLAWNFDSGTKTRTLLFAWVELLPTEIPPPIDDYDPKGGFRLGGKSKHRIFIRHAITSARHAIDWYRSCLFGKAILPENDGTFPANGDTRKELVLAELDEEPKWPALVSATGDKESLPFVPEWIQCPRTHHLIPKTSFDLDALWREKTDQEIAHQWLASQLHFDLYKYSEHWGSVHLVAPNPVYRSLNTSRARADGSLLFTFQPRAGKSLDGLTLAVRNKGPWGVTGYTTTPVRERSIPLRGVGDVNSIEVWDRRRGVLAAFTQAPCRGFAVETAMNHQLLVKGTTEEFEVTRRGESQRITMGESSQSRIARARLLEGRDTRRKQKKGTAQGQQWFRGQKEEARAVLRAILNEANEAVLFIDPYFKDTELMAFAPAVGSIETTVRVLTSASMLKKMANGGERLQTALEWWSGKQRMNRLEIRVMRGDRPAIHDRFLCVDDRIWMLGSSLNEFGSRGTMLLALPYPEGVRDDLIEAWNEAVPLKTWLSERTAKSG